MWSVPPAEPPPQETEPGIGLELATRSASVLIAELAGTTITSYSPVRRAIGVVWSRLTGDLLVMMPPTITRPSPSAHRRCRDYLLTSWARPTVPPAPAMFST